MRIRTPSFFEGLEREDLEEIRRRLERRRFPSGALVIAQGDSPHEMYIIESGTADVFMVDRDGVPHLINRVAAGATLGEMSLLAGNPASATVRATQELDVLVLSESEFDRVVTRFPRIYRNIGAIVSERLARSDRRSLWGTSGRVTLLRGRAGRAEVAYGLAASLAWHTGAPAALVVVTDDPSDDLQALAQQHRPDPQAAGAGGNGPARDPGAAVWLARSGDPEPLEARIDDLRGSYDHVLVLAPEETALLFPASRSLTLAEGGHVRAHGHDPPELDVRIGGDGAAAGRPRADGVLSVPDLGAADESALRSGLLPPTTEAGKALGWLARDVAGLKVGLALGAGSLKGYAHIGVLLAFERVGVPVDYLAGTSIGAAVAAMYAAGMTPQQTGEVLDRVGANLFRLALPMKGLLSSAALRETIRTVAGERQIEDLPIPLAIVAADIVTKREVVFRRGLVWRAVLASVSIPGVYPAVRIGDHTLVDGGILNPVPSNVAAEMGGDAVIAVKLGEGPARTVGEMDESAAEGRVPWVLEAITRSIEVMESKMSTDTAAAATILIAPELKDVPAQRLRRFREGRRYIEAGEAAVEDALPRLGSALPWLRAS